MSNEEIKELSIKSSEELDRLKDKLLDQEEEIERLNNIINKVIELIERNENKATNEIIFNDIAKALDILRGNDE